MTWHPSPRARLVGTDQFVHGDTDHVLSGNDRTGDGKDRAILVTITDPTLLRRHSNCSSSRLERLYGHRKIGDKASGAVRAVVNVLDKVREAEVMLDEA